MKKRLRKPYVVSQAFFGVQTFMRLLHVLVVDGVMYLIELLVQIFKGVNLFVLQWCILFLCHSYLRLRGLVLLYHLLKDDATYLNFVRSQMLR